MALKAKDDTKRTYHITLEGHPARVMDAMVLMFGGGAKGGAQYVITELVSDEYKRQKTSFDTFMAEHPEELEAMLKSDEKRATKPPQKPTLVDKKAANA